MIQTVTIRQQILQALQRVYDSMGFDELLSADRLEKELLAEFSPSAFALTPADGFDEIALANGYVKLAKDEMVVKLRSAHDPERARRKDMCHIEIDALAKSAGYIKLEPGQVVVDEHPFTDEEADYLLEAIEWTKCSDCDDQCKARGNCLYLNIRAKLTEIKEARDE